jgi:hypothetical protein
MRSIQNLPLEQVKRNTLALAKTVCMLSICVIMTTSREDRLQGTLLPVLAESCWLHLYPLSSMPVLSTLEMFIIRGSGTGNGNLQKASHHGRSNH